MVFKGNNTPSWIIFIVDIGICVFSLTLAYLVRFNFNIPDNEIQTFTIVFPFVLITRAISFWIFQIHRGIIRYTSTKDAQRIFSVSSVGALFFLFSNVIRYYFYDGAFMVPFSIIIIEYLATVFLMIGLRITVKLIYFEFKNYQKEKNRIGIYGAGESGIITKRSFDRVTSTSNSVVAFFDDNPNKVGKKIEGVYIYSFKKLEQLALKRSIDTLIISVQNIRREKKLEIVEQCLKLNIKVLNVPPAHDWVNGELTYRQIRKVKIEELLGRDQIKLNEEQIKKYLHQKSILITGAAGSIGSELARQIAPYSPNKLILLDQAESPLADLEQEIIANFGENYCEIVLADIRNNRRINWLFNYFRPDIVFHAAAYKSVPVVEDNPGEAVRTNVQGTKTLVETAGKYNVDSFIMISTDKAVNPTNVMGATKRLAEIIAQSANHKFKTKYITTRFGNVLGSNGSVIPLFKNQIENGGPVTVTHRDITRFFMTIPEACHLVIEAGNMGHGGEIYVFDMGEPIKILELAKKMIKLSGFELGKDIDIRITGLRQGEKLYEELLASEENTLSTHHPKILIGTVREYDYDKVIVKVEELIELQRAQQFENMVKKMKEIIPEFKSNNSIYVKLDRALENEKSSMN